MDKRYISLVLFFAVFGYVNAEDALEGMWFLNDYVSKNMSNTEIREGVLNHMTYRTSMTHQEIREASSTVRNASSAALQRMRDAFEEEQFKEATDFSIRQFIPRNNTFIFYMDGEYVCRGTYTITNNNLITISPTHIYGDFINFPEGWYTKEVILEVFIEAGVDRREIESFITPFFVNRYMRYSVNRNNLDLIYDFGIAKYIKR